MAINDQSIAYNIQNGIVPYINDNYVCLMGVIRKEVNVDGKAKRSDPSVQEIMEIQKY